MMHLEMRCRFSESLDKSVTHLIVARPERRSSPPRKLVVALRNQQAWGISIVTDAWLHACKKEHRLLPACDFALNPQDLQRMRAAPDQVASRPALHQLDANAQPATMLQTASTSKAEAQSTANKAACSITAASNVSIERAAQPVAQRTMDDQQGAQRHASLDRLHVSNQHEYVRTSAALLELF